MNRPPDLLEDLQLVERNLLRDMAHPVIDHPLPAETERLITDRVLFAPTDSVEPVVEAATGEPLGDGACVSKYDIDAAVAAACSA
jgi:hypothetical protein